MKLDIDILTPSEIEKFMRTCTRCDSGVRDKALIAVLAGSGLRITEALSLKEGDFDPDRGTLTVHRGKGGKRRVCGITPVAKAQLSVWLERRRGLGLNGRQPIFCQLKPGIRGNSMVSANVRQMFKRRGKKAGLDKRVHPHGLRHYFAYAMAEGGIPVHRISAQLGHSNVATTSTYINHLGAFDAVESVRDLETLAVT